MASVLVSRVVDHGFIGGVMVSVLVSSVVDREFICGVMVRRAFLECVRSWVHRWGNGSRDKHANHYPTDELMIYHTRDKHANHYLHR
jgi:hypothetical protein